MREILFRGKRKDNGEWATATSIFEAECFGELRFYINSLSNATVYFNSDGNITRTEAELDCEWLEVIQETVGQFTGLTDKNGKKIFEGDFIRVHGENGWYSDYACRWDEGNLEFGIANKTESIGLGYFAPHELVIIGNIHDNPELLKGGVS
jgi:uncharacterized phage protein (TIGR01671 family)